MADDRTILNYYKSFAKKIKGDIDQINRETWNIKLLKFRLGLVKWFKKHYRLILYILLPIGGSIYAFLKFVSIPCISVCIDIPFRGSLCISDN